MDRESIASYSLVIVATDGGFVPLTQTQTVLVTILDENDNPPLFNPISVTCSLFETDPVGTVCMTIFSTDADVGNNATATYSIVGGFTPLCDSTGKICVEEQTGRVVSNASLLFDALAGQTSQDLVIRLSAHDRSPREYLGGVLPGQANG